MMNIPTEKYKDSIDRLPAEGKHIIANQAETSMVVYQAFKPSIAKYAIDHQKFGGVNYSFNRMSWIKPNFLWMMYRSGWARKESQESILAITISKAAFDEILDAAVISSYDSEYYSTREEWKTAIAESEIRLQWDPDHDPFGNKVERRAVQLGLRGSSLHKFVHEQIEKIEDLTEFVLVQSKCVKDNDLSKLEIPFEEVYRPSDAQLVEKLKLAK